MQSTHRLTDFAAAYSPALTAHHRSRIRLLAVLACNVSLAATSPSWKSCMASLLPTADRAGLQTCCAGKHAKLWATFNEPEVACLCGHIMGNHPPGKRMQFKHAGQKLCNMLRAHAAAYKVIKQLPGTAHSCSGALSSHLLLTCGFPFAALAVHLVWAQALLPECSALVSVPFTKTQQYIQ